MDRQREIDNLVGRWSKAGSELVTSQAQPYSGTLRRLSLPIRQAQECLLDGPTITEERGSVTETDPPCFNARTAIAIRSGSNLNLACSEPLQDFVSRRMVHHAGLLFVPSCKSANSARAEDRLSAISS